MKNALYELFDLVALSQDGKITKEQQAAELRAEPWVHRLEELAETTDEFDGIWSAALEVGEADSPLWFARGFRLGARLMLEVLG